MPFDWPSNASPALRRLAPANLHLPRIARPQALTLPPRGSPSRGVASVLLLIGAVIVFLVIFDWNWFRGPLAHIASQRANRSVAILGDLDVHPWSLSPSAEVHDITVSQPAFFKSGEMGKIGTVGVKVKLLPLFAGRQVLERLEVTQPDVRLQRDLSGRNNWQFGDPLKKGTLKLPTIEHFVLTDGHVRLDDKLRKLTLDGVVNTSEHTVGPDKGAFSLKGKGTINAEPFTLVLTGAPLLHVTADHPWPFKADLHAGATHATADASIDRPFDLTRFGGALTISGDDLADLYGLTRVVLPNTPPYKVSGKLRRTGPRYDFKAFNGRIGDSDIAGDLYVKTGGKRVYLNADARSHRLDFDDIGPIFGLAPGTGRGETASAKQKVQAARQKATGYILPDATLQVERIRAMDADVTYRAETVNAPGWPLRAVSLDMTLKDGVLVADPLSFDFSRGRLAGRVKLDASAATPRTDLDMRLTNARLEDWIKLRTLGKAPIEGALIARARLTGYGNSVHRAASSADGHVTVAMPSGTMRQAFAELLGINLTKGLFMLLSEDPKQTPVRCAVGEFQATRGVLNAQTLVLDTGVVVAHGKGTIDLRNESLNLKFDGDSKKFRLVRLLSPITIKGPIVKPKIGIEPGPAVAQGVVGLVLGAAVNPLAALIPFVDLGGAKDADCAGLLAHARAQGVR